MTIAPPEPEVRVTFDDLYQGARGSIYRALAVITDDRDLATEAVDVGFTKWRRKLRRPAGISPAAGVMRFGYGFARKQAGKSSALSGFRLGAEATSAPLLERFRALGIDERGLLVMKHVLDWDDAAISHAIGAEGVSAVLRSLHDRLGSEGIDIALLGESLRRSAAGYVEPLSRLDTVKAKGGIQRLAAFVGGAAVAAAAVVGAVAFIGSLGSSGTESAASGATVSSTVTAATGPELTAENAIWQRVPMPVNSQNIMTLAHDGENFVMLASDDRGRPAMLESENGLDWAQIPAPPAGQNMWFQQMIAANDQLILIGNGFDEIRGRESTVVYISGEDGGWVQADLPLEDSVELDGQVLDLYTWVSNVSVTDSGFTIVGNQGAEFDFDRMLREIVDPELMNQGWGFDGNGMQFYDDRGNVVQTMTWEELGISPELGALVSGNRPIIWTSADGIEWDSTVSDVPPGVQGIGSYIKTNGAEAVLGWGNRGQSVWVKSGTEWVRPDIEASIVGLTTWNDKILVSGHDNSTGEPSMWTSADGATWERSALPVSIQQFYPSGDAIVGFGFEDAFAAIGPAEIAVGDLTVQNTTDGRFVVLDAEGATLLEVFEEDIVRGEQITINDPDTGEQVVQFSSQELENAWTVLYQQLEQQNPGPPQMSIVVSSDGVNWTVLQPEEPNFFPQAVAFGNNSALMAGWVEGDGFFPGGGGMRLLLVTAE